MEQFSLEKYLENPSRKVVTRTGEEVKIIDTNAPDKNNPIVGYIYHKQKWNGPWTWHIDGVYKFGGDDMDLFFEDEENLNILDELKSYLKNTPKEQIEKDWKEIQEWYAQYFTNEKHDEEEELTEFEKEVSTLLTDIVYDYESEQDLCDNEYVRNITNKFLDLARKELEKEIGDKCWEAYLKGEEEALKDLPKWKKMPNGIQGNGDFNPTYLVRVSNGYYFTTPCLSWDKDSMYIELAELDKLPKEE